MLFYLPKFVSIKIPLTLENLSSLIKHWIHSLQDYFSGLLSVKCRLCLIWSFLPIFCPELCTIYLESIGTEYGRTVNIIFPVQDGPSHLWYNCELDIEVHEKLVLEVKQILHDAVTFKRMRIKNFMIVCSEDFTDFLRWPELSQNTRIFIRTETITKRCKKKLEESAWRT